MFFRFASAVALAAAGSMVAAPLAAAELPRLSDRASVAASAVFDSAATNADGYRRWRHRDRVDAGDVIAGVLVLGTIAAVASAASKAKQDRTYRYPQRYPYPDRPYDYRSRPLDSRYDGRGLDGAVDTCVREVERNGAVDAVDRAERTGTGWHVSGRTRGGAPFDCTIGSDGRIEAIDMSGRGAVNDGQWDDDRYAAARAAQDGAAAPAYPGGPIGNEADDGRYDAAAAPDFQG